MWTLMVFAYAPLLPWLQCPTIKRFGAGLDVTLFGDPNAIIT